VRHAYRVQPVNASAAAISFVTGRSPRQHPSIDSSGHHNNIGLWYRNTRRFPSRRPRRPQSPIRPYSEWTGDLPCGPVLRRGCTAEMKITFLPRGAGAGTGFEEHQRPVLPRRPRALPAGKLELVKSGSRHPRSSGRNGRAGDQPDAHAIFAAQAVLDHLELQRAPGAQDWVAFQMRCRS